MSFIYVYGQIPGRRDNERPARVYQGLLLEDHYQSGANEGLHERDSTLVVKDEFNSLHVMQLMHKGQGRGTYFWVYANEFETLAVYVKGQSYVSREAYRDVERMRVQMEAKSE